MCPAWGDGCWQRVLGGGRRPGKQNQPQVGTQATAGTRKCCSLDPMAGSHPVKTETRADQGQGLWVGRGPPTASTHEPHLTTHSASSADHTRLGMAGKARPW